MTHPLPAGIMPDFREVLPDLLKQNYGKWVWHESLAPGVLRHLTADGVACITVRVQLPPNGLLSAPTLRLLARWMREYARGGRKTSRQGFELVGVAADRLENLLADIRAQGFVVGGTRNALRQLKGCTGHVHCQNGAIDPPSIMKSLGDALYEDFVNYRYPAQLKLSVSGCPNQCGAGIEGDIGILGVYLDAPKVDDQVLARSTPDFGLLCRWCPGGAIKLKQVPEGRSIAVNEERCIHCSSCAMVAPEAITMGPARSASIAVGGRGPSRKDEPRLARVAFTCVPVNPPDYPELVARVQTIIEAWRAGARPGERMADYIDRVGWEPFLQQVGAV